MAVMLSYRGLMITVLFTCMNAIETVFYQSQCGNVNFVANYMSAQYISSPNYPKDYPSNTDCMWHIKSSVATRVVEFRLLDFTIEDSQFCANDYMTIYDGNSTNAPLMQKLCGQVPGTSFISTGPNLTVVFHSDSTISYSGFNFYFYSDDKSGECSNVNLFATDAPQYFTSPNYPNGYPGKSLCYWFIAASSTSKVVVLELLDLDLENTSSCYQDHLDIYDALTSSSGTKLATLCGQVSPTIFTSTGNFMYVDFKSVIASNKKGFKIQYTSQTLTEHSSIYNFKATDSAEAILSPNYRESLFLSNTHNTYYITAASSDVVVLMVRVFDLENSPACANDSVTIYDGNSATSPKLQTLCGTLQRTIINSTGNEMTLVFKSDSFNNNGRFYLMYRSQAKTDGCTFVSLVATKTVKKLSSPNYPNPYPNFTGCQWHITASSKSDVIELTIVDLDVQNSSACYYEYVSVYDGNNAFSNKIATVCGKILQKTFTSSGAYMTVLFQSDSDNEFIINKHSGLQFTFRSRSSTATSAEVHLLDLFSSDKSGRS